MKKNGWIFLLMVLSFVANAGGQVRNLNTYIGAGVGASTDAFYNETVASGKAFAGVAYNTYSALEASYAYLGSYSNGQVSENAVALSVVGFAPLMDSLSLVIRAGYYYYQLSTSSTTLNGSDITYGLGLKYNFDYRNAVRAEWERYSNLVNSDIDMFTVSYSYRFGIQ